MLIAFGLLSVMTGDFIGGMWRFLVGMFLRDAAAMSYRDTLARAALQGVPISRLMTRQPISVPPDTSVASFIEEFFYRYHHRSFPVTRDDTLVGCVGTEQAARIDRSDWPNVWVERIMLKCRAEEVVDAEADARAALMRMRRYGQSRLWVVREGRLVGVLSLSDILELLSTKLELEAGRQSRPTA